MSNIPSYPDAIRDGSARRPQAIGTRFHEDRDGNVSSCAQGAALEGGGCVLDVRGGNNYGRIDGGQGWGGLVARRRTTEVEDRWCADGLYTKSAAVACPKCSSGSGDYRWSVWSMTPHLNDEHGMSREAIAMWAETTLEKVRAERDTKTKNETPAPVSGEPVKVEG